MSSNNYPFSHHQHQIPSSKSPGQQYKPSLPSRNINQAFHQQPLAGGYVRPEYVAPQQWSSFGAAQNQYGSSQVSLGGPEGVESAPRMGNGHMAATSISTQAGALIATATMASAHQHHNSVGVRQTSSGTGQGGYDYAAAYAHESSYPQQSLVSTPSTSCESGQPLYRLSGTQQQTQNQYFSYSTVPQGTGATYAPAYQSAAPSPPFPSTQQQSRAAAARTTTSEPRPRASRSAAQVSEKPTSPTFKPMPHQPLPIAPVVAQTPPKRVHPRSGKSSLLAAAVNHANSQLLSTSPATAAKSAVPETSYSTGPSYQTTNVQAAAQQPISMLRTPVQAAAARQAPAPTPAIPTSQVSSKYRGVFSTAKDKEELAQSLPDANPDPASVALYSLARDQEQRQQKQQQQQQRQRQQQHQRQRQHQRQQQLAIHQQLKAGAHLPPLNPNVSSQASQTQHEAAPHFQTQPEGQQAQPQAYIPTQTQNPPAEPSRNSLQCHDTRYEPQPREAAPILQPQPEYNNDHPLPAPQHLPQPTPQAQGTPEPEQRQSSRVDPATLEQKMRDMLERMRYYQSQDPQTFQAVWESVRKSNSSTAQIASGGDDGHPKSIMPGASNPPQNRVASVSPLADSPLAKPADVVSGAASRQGENSSHARPSMQNAHSQGSGSRTESPGIVSQDSDNRPPPVPALQTIGARAQYSTQITQPATIVHSRPPHIHEALPQTQTPNESLTSHGAVARDNLPSAIGSLEKPRSTRKHGWNLKQRKHIAGVAAKYLSSVSDKQVPEEVVMKLLDKNNHFVSLCEGLESRGLRFDRGAFARRLLQETSAPELAKGTLGCSAGTGGHSPGARVLGEVHDTQDGNVQWTQREVNQIHTVPKPAAMTNAVIATAATPHATYNRGRPSKPITAAVLTPSKTPVAQTTQTSVLPTSPASIVHTTQLLPVSSSPVFSSPLFPPSPSAPPPHIAEGAITPQHLNHNSSAHDIPGHPTSVKAAHNPPPLNLPIRSSTQQSQQFLLSSMAHRATSRPPPPPSQHFAMEQEPSPVAAESDLVEKLQVERDSRGKTNNRSQFEQGSTNASLPRVENLRQLKSLIVKLPMRSHKNSIIVEPPLPRDPQSLNRGPLLTRPLSTLQINTKLPPTNIPPIIDLTGMTPTPEPQAPTTPPSKEFSSTPKINTKDIPPASTTLKVSEQENAPEPEVVFHTPVVDLIRRSQVARKSSYNQPNIARDVLLAAGRHSTLGGLNSDLAVLRRALPSTFNAPVDLATIRWDILDPSAPGDNGETDDEGFITLPAAVSVGRPGAAGAVVAMATTPGPKRGRRPTGRGKHIKAPLAAPTGSAPPPYAQPFPQPLSQPLSQPTSRPMGKRGRRTVAPRPTSSFSTGATSGSGAGVARISSPGGNPEGGSGSVNRPNEAFYVQPGRRDRSSVGSSGLLNDTTPQGGSRIAVIIPSRNASSSSNATPAPPDDRKRKLEEKTVNARPGKNPKLTISPMRPSGYKVFPCRWKQCEAQLHNYETLCRHVMRKHKHAANNGSFECQWEGCSKDPQVSSLPEKTAFQFPNEGGWEQHVLAHLGQVKEQFGLGPAVLASDYESGVSDVDYMSDRDGNRVTPIAVPAPSGYPFAPPPGYKMNSHFRKAHDIGNEKQTRATRTFDSEMEGGRATGAGAVEEGGRPWNDDGEGWKEDYVAEVEDSPEPGPDAKTGDATSG